jgi:hypothetical protein
MGMVTLIMCLRSTRMCMGIQGHFGSATIDVEMDTLLIKRECAGYSADCFEKRKNKRHSESTAVITCSKMYNTNVFYPVYMTQPCANALSIYAMLRHLILIIRISPEQYCPLFTPASISTQHYRIP